MKKVLLIIGGLLLTFVILFIGYLIDKKISEKKEYKEYLKREADKINDGITYDIPKEFNTNDNVSYHIYTSDIDCRFEFINEEKNAYNDKKIEDFLKENIYVSLDYDISEVISNETNNLNYLLITVEKNNNKTYYYAFDTNKYYYLYEYRITDYNNGDREDLDTNICYTAKDKILNSIEIKR